MQAEAPTDAALIDATLRGDRSAFGQIVERYQRAVYAVSYSSVRDRALSDDLTQETFVTAWRRLADLRDAARLPAWLCGIARNLGRDARKRLGREIVDEPPEVALDETPFDAISDAESERLVAGALDGVPDAYREPLVLFYYEQQSVKDVARALGISEPATHQRLSRGRQLLAQRVTALVERTLARRGPREGLAVGVLAAIAVTAPAAHVEASPLPAKGSIMSKLVISASLLAVAVGGTVTYVATRPPTARAAQPGDATAATATHATPSTAPTARVVRDRAAMIAALTSPHVRKPAPVAAATAPAPDCAAVGRHLAALDTDGVHAAMPHEPGAPCDGCVEKYTTACTQMGWNAEQRTCILGATSLINAHVMCGHATASAPPAAPLPADLAPNLTCTALAKHAAELVAGDAGDAGMAAVPDLEHQAEDACEQGPWSLELRTCLAATTSFDDIHACIN